MIESKDTSRKIKPLVITILASVLILTGCTNKIFINAVDQGKLALANKEYDKAKFSFELALEEKQDDEITHMLEQVDYMLSGSKAKEDQNADEAMAFFDKIINNDNPLPSILKDAIQLKTQLESDLQLREDTLNKYKHGIVDAENMLIEKEYTQSKEILTQIMNETENQEEFVLQYKKAQALLKQIHTELAQIEETKKQEVEARKAAEKTPENKKIYTLSEVCKIAEDKMGLLGAHRFDDDLMINDETSYFIEIEFMAGDMPRTDQVYIGSETLNVYNYDESFRMSLR